LYSVGVSDSDLGGDRLMSGAIESLLERNLGITAAAVVLDGGGMGPSVIPEGADRSRFATAAASILDVCADSADTVGAGGPTQAVIAGKTGFVAIVSAGVGRYLLCTTDAEADLGRVLLEMRAVADGLDPDEGVESASMKQG
jgi:predicted regulator of Ras-like GTPase activity (Roadblock/LC7/MglB family)